MTPEDETKLLVDVAVIVEKVSTIEKDISPQVKKNTRFRFMITGFVIISIPLFGVILKVMAK